MFCVIITVLNCHLICTYRHTRFSFAVTTLFFPVFAIFNSHIIITFMNCNVIHIFRLFTEFNLLLIIYDPSWGDFGKTFLLLRLFFLRLKKMSQRKYFSHIKILPPRNCAAPMQLHMLHLPKYGPLFIRSAICQQ